MPLDGNQGRVGCGWPRRRRLIR